MWGQSEHRLWRIHTQSRGSHARLIEAVTNLIHRIILMVLYGTGICRTKPSPLKITQIDSQLTVIHIRQGSKPADYRFLARSSNSPHAGLIDYDGDKATTLFGGETTCVK